LRHLTEKIAMNEMPRQLLRVDLSDGYQFNFLSFDEISNWLALEQSAFRWLIEGAPQAGGGVANLRTHYANAFNNLSQTLAAWRNEPDDPERMKQFANVLIRLQDRPAIRLPPSTRTNGMRLSGTCGRAVRIVRRLRGKVVVNSCRDKLHVGSHSIANRAAMAGPTPVGSAPTSSWARRFVAAEGPGQAVKAPRRKSPSEQFARRTFAQLGLHPFPHLDWQRHLR
jgi:hypothetical protein